MRKNYRDYLLYIGIISLVLGIFLFTRPNADLSLVMLVIGLTWFIQGIFSMLAIFGDMQDWGWKLFGGVVSIAAGLLVVSNPVANTASVPTDVVIILGIFGMMIGIAALISAFRGDGWESGLIGTISIVLAMPLIFNSQVGGAVLVWVAAILLVIQGIFGVGMSFKKNKG